MAHDNYELILENHNTFGTMANSVISMKSSGRNNKNRHSYK